MSLIENIAAAFSARSRKKKYAQFIEHLNPNSHDTIIDIGVNTTEYSPSDNYLEKYFPHQKNITAIGTDDGSSFESFYPDATYVRADGKNLPFSENAFDIAYSNAVIEHVGSGEQQSQFLREMYRVGKKGYLTTPNRYFPIELHTRLPVLHLILSKKIFDAFLRCIGKSWATGEYMTLLSEKELRSLIATAGISHYKLFHNRFLGLTMTFTIIWQKHDSVL